VISALDALEYEGYHLQWHFIIVIKVFIAVIMNLFFPFDFVVVWQVMMVLK